MRMSELEGRNTRFSANVIKLEKKTQNLKLLMCYITEYRIYLREISLFSPFLRVKLVKSSFSVWGRHICYLPNDTY